MQLAVGLRHELCYVIHIHWNQERRRPIFWPKEVPGTAAAGASPEEQEDPREIFDLLMILGMRAYQSDRFIFVVLGAVGPLVLGVLR